MSMKFEFDADNFFNGLEKALNIGIDGIQKAVFGAAEQLKGDSTEIVPFDHGFSGGLASTARASNPKLSTSEVESTVSYNKKYAVRLHEDMSLKISQKNAGAGKKRQHKYLEKPMRENAKKYGKLMAQIISQSL